MELWTVGNKLIVWFYVVAIAYFAGDKAPQSHVLYFLLYVGLNLIVHIAKAEQAKKALAAAVLLLLILAGKFETPYFWLLIPLSLLELAGFYVRRQWQALILVLAPLFFLPDELYVSYGFIALLVFFNNAVVRLYVKGLHVREGKLDDLRIRMQQLSRRLNDNAEFAEASEYLVKLEERNRLAQAIHDGLGHAMTGALIQMEAAKIMLSRDQAAAEGLLNNAIAISKDGIEQIRQTLKETKPQLEQLGFGRLRTAVERFGAKTGLQTTVIQQGDIAVITPLQWKVIYENVMEALTNSAKYAGATAVHIEVSVLNQYIKAVVSDDGEGAAKIVKGLGLIGMEERAAAVNGTVVADGNHGFTVTTLIPRAVNI
ncbi:sensor histidine kinase [Paenibacillus protaetiae]|uniref:histidine kinase n=1 Tax=Paenibacillus protaetiae TaxID=2509456 RepID=A0A4V0YET1_9BACL|nr:histidine kinase [Paenibacillus protaetiae]QAY65291.1 sensor histidine kinase [Paenibacillus protaetiae]